MKLALIRERKNPPDKRVVLTPKACSLLKERYPELEIVVEKSPNRAFSDQEYADAGLELVDDPSTADVMLGVKEVPITALIPGKKYFFFSHTIKEQPYNRDLLRSILEKDIELHDHEVITDQKGIRLVAFGRYAGIVGAYNGIRTLGIKDETFALPKAETLKDQQDLIEEMKTAALGPVKVLLTGKGRVGNGAKEMLDGMGLKEVDADAYLKENFDQAVYTQIDVMDYNKRKDGTEGSMQDFFDYPEGYESDFFRFARVTDLYIAGHFYASGAPYLFTREDAKAKDFKIRAVADISCDIDGPVASTLRASTIADPIYGYDATLEQEGDYRAEGCIAVMAVDNLPNELPREASKGFSEGFVKHVIPAFFDGDSKGILSRSMMTENKQLTKDFKYLQNYVDGL